MVAAIFVGILISASTTGQTAPHAPPASPTPSAPPSPPVLPEAALTDAQRLDRLFARLKAAESAQAAKPFAVQIERAFERSGSDTADLLLQRIKQAIEAKKNELALDLSDYLITLKPDWAEPYHRRSIVHFLLRDEEAAMRDIRAALAREPRHFHALAGLGTMFRTMGNDKAAYNAFTKTLEIHPYFSDLKATHDKMRSEIEGKPI